ncbi:hypothetical protein [Dactylosporangium matsuzakiense]|uniref:Uncharacterized protein n=1 Tax=Dactylosporangium matsuzakiense TaxID=53360 RepID=A0A9W6KGL2_9ACTN|nr:hypothetical protein [Dactylosporangium matsuzakiense]UWZ46750.1 hypothetical protein Dmats_10195 [Dactylosporangium matsuzakiense]GLL01711.1 hypothetical protein GCM10017581_034530 [Dactylosporangium matsuzakiense]
MTTPHDLFTFELEWEQRGSLFVLRNDDRSSQSRAFARAAEERLFRARGVVSAEVVLAPGLPVWSLLHLNPDPFGSMWCFVEQGRGGAFPSDGGCRASFAKLGRNHPADVWRAGRAAAWVAAPTADPDPALAYTVLSAITAERNRIVLPADAVSNAALIEAVLSLLPPRVAAGWLWSTHLFGAADRFIAGRSDEDRGPAPQVPAELRLALDRLAAQVGRLDPETGRLVRSSRADYLSEFLETFPPAAAPPPGEPGLRSAGPLSHAAPEAAAADPAPSELTQPMPITPGRHPVPGRDLSAEETQRLPVAAVVAARGRVQPLRWVRWADLGRGFRAQDDEGAPALRRYWTVAEKLLEAEKVPNGVDNTLKYPLWTLRPVSVEGAAHWCFIERGRGNLVGADGQLQKDRQFGMAGGIRFGFAPAQLLPIDVWRSGTKDAWTPVGRPPKGWPTANRDVVRQVFAALGTGQARVHLPGDPAQNWLVIEQTLAVLPRRLAARWAWSTCLFQTRDAFVAGSAPSDLHDSESIARLAQQVAAKKLPESAQRFLDTLSKQQADAFEFLLQQAERAAEKGRLGKELTNLLRRSEADDLRDFLAEMADRLNLSPMRMEDVPGKLRTREGQNSLHDSDADLVARYAEAAPVEARRHLHTDPRSPVAPELTEGLRSRQVAEPGENQFDIPTARQSATAWTKQSTDLLRHHTDEDERVELMATVTAPGGVLHDPADLQAAEQFVSDLGLPQERFPHLYPSALIRTIVEVEDLSKRVEQGVRDSADPERLLYMATTHLTQPTVRKAAWIMMVLDDAMVANGSTSDARRRIANRLLATRPKKEQTEFWSAVVRTYPMGTVEAQVSRIFDAGTTVLFERNRQRPLDSPDLYELQQQVGSHVTVAMVRKPAAGAGPGRLHGFYDRLGQRMRATRVNGVRVAGLSALGVVVVVAVLIGTHVPSGTPAGGTPSPSATARGPAISQVDPEPTPEESSSSAPPPSEAPAGQTRPLKPIEAKWQTGSNTEDAVREIRDGIFKQAGKQSLQIKSLVLDCYSDIKQHADDAVQRVTAGLVAAMKQQLDGVVIDGRAHWKDGETGLPQLKVPGCRATVELRE